MPINVRNTVNVVNTMKLVRALESGKYKQARKKLRRGDRFCCLGVACDISKLGKWTDTETYFDKSDILPSKVQRWLGIDSTMAVEFSADEYENLADMNDKGCSFKRIAAVIRKKLGKPRKP